MESWFVYVLYSDDFDRYYTGMAEDTEKRLKQHNAGKTKSTKAYRPWRKIFEEMLPSRAEARKREIYWKSGDGREKIKRLRSLTG
jgi:putative endonuclease